MSLRWAVIVLVPAIAVGVGGYVYVASPDHQSERRPEAGQANAALAEVSLPEALSARGKLGQRAFDAKCASCHGRNAAGRDGLAPPLVHNIYEPGHHGDESFQRAVAMGVRAHHWTFGNMPPVEGLTRGDVSLIVAYIRELQRANGIQ